MAIVKFVSDKDCQVFIDMELAGKVASESMLKVTLETGGYLIQVKDEDGNLIKEYDLEIKPSDNQLLQKIDETNDKLDDVIEILKNDSSLVFHCNRASFCHNGLYGFVDKKLNVVIPPIYYSVNEFVDDKAFVVRDFPEGRKTTMIDSDGNIFFNRWFDYIGESDNTILLGIENRIIVYSKTKYDQIAEYHNANYDYKYPFIPVYKIDGLDKLYGFIDFDGKEVVPLIYDFVWNYKSNGFAEVKRFGQNSYVDTCGNLYDHPNENSTKISKEDSCTRGFGGLYGNGNMWSDIPTKVAGKWGLLSPYERCDGKERFLFECDKILYYNLGCFIYRIHNLCFFIQIDNSEQTYSYEADEIIPIILRKGEYGEDVVNLIIKKNGKYGIIDINGKEIIPIQYDNIETTEGVLECYPGEVGIINYNNLVSIVQMKNGKILFPFEYEDIKPTDVTHNRYWREVSWYIVMKNGKYGCIKPDGEVVLPLEYDRISHLLYEKDDSYSHRLYIKKGSKYGLYTITRSNMLAGYGGDESTSFEEYNYNPFGLIDI